MLGLGALAASSATVFDATGLMTATGWAKTGGTASGWADCTHAGGTWTDGADAVATWTQVSSSEGPFDPNVFDLALFDATITFGAPTRAAPNWN